MKLVSFSVALTLLIKFLELDLIIVLIDSIIEDLDLDINLIVENLRVLSLEELEISSLEDLILDLITLS